MNLTGNTPADQYQKLKLIQNTVRVYGSLYTANLGPLAAYKRAIVDPSAGLYGVCWNQMSDRPVPSVQRASVPTGYNNSLNRRHSSVTSSKPGSQTPGGAGCDIKHNSYDRYLNRLKGKGPLRRGVIPRGFGAPIPFNPAFPVYGGKTTKTNIVTGCNCVSTDPTWTQADQSAQIYNDPLWHPYPSGNCESRCDNTCNTFTMGEVAEHNTQDDCWVVITGFVYNITEYVQGGGHPGDPISFDGLCGQDVTGIFYANHTNPDQAAVLLAPYCVGTLV
jgi:cytochrome b involved in lipid metabolism